MSVEHLKDALPEVVRIRTSSNPATLGIDTNGLIIAYSLDGMSCFPVEKYEDIIRVQREEQLMLLATCYRNVMREIALMGLAPGMREMQRMCALASGLSWKEPEGRAAGAHHAYVSAEEAIRYMVGQQDKERSKKEHKR